MKEVKDLTTEEEKNLKTLLGKKLDYWCEQYEINAQFRGALIADAFRVGDYEKAEKFANDNSESKRISENIKAFENAWKRVL